MNSKQCSKCKQVKNLSFFNRQSVSKDGYRPDCKQCVKKQRIERAEKDPLSNALVSLSNGIMKRTKWAIHKPKNQIYKKLNIQNKLGETPAEIRQVLKAHFANDILNILRKGEAPSVDRINPSGNYEISNIRIIPLKENVKLGATKGAKSTSKPIHAFDNNGKCLGTFESISSCARHLNLKRDTIIRHVKAGTTTRYGLSFQYTNEGDSIR